MSMAMMLRAKILIFVFLDAPLESNIIFCHWHNGSDSPVDARVAYGFTKIQALLNAPPNSSRAGNVDGGRFNA
jgi:hypothetical protein